MRKWLFGILIIGLLLGCVATSKLSELVATEPSPDAFQLTATYFISEATRLSEEYGTPPPSSLDLTSTAYIQSMTVEAPTLDAICPERTVHVWKIDVGHIPETSEIEIQVEQSRESPAYCPDYEQYEYYVSIWISRAATQTAFGEVFDEVIKTLPDYPPQDENAIDSVALYFWDERFRPVFVGTFPYTDAIAAYESGLRGVELLDALGIEVPE